MLCHNVFSWRQIAWPNNAKLTESNAQHDYFWIQWSRCLAQEDSNCLRDLGVLHTLHPYNVKRWTQSHYELVTSRNTSILSEQIDAKALVCWQELPSHQRGKNTDLQRLDGMSEIKSPLNSTRYGVVKWKGGSYSDFAKTLWLNMLIDACKIEWANHQQKEQRTAQGMWTGHFRAYELKLKWGLEKISVEFPSYKRELRIFHLPHFLHLRLLVVVN